MMTCIFEYSQGGDPRWTASGPLDHSAVQKADGARDFSLKRTASLPTSASKGACTGITVYWLIQRALGAGYSEFWNVWLKPPRQAAPRSESLQGGAGEAVESIKKVMVDVQSLYRNGNTPLVAYTDLAKRRILEGAKHHLTNQRGMVIRKNTNFMNLAYEMAVTKGYVIAMFYCEGWGSHAIAAHVCDKGIVEFMDPNLGEYGPDRTSLRSNVSLVDFYNFVRDTLKPYYENRTITEFTVYTLQRPGTPL